MRLSQKSHKKKGILEWIREEEGKMKDMIKHLEKQQNIFRKEKEQYLEQLIGKEYKFKVLEEIIDFNTIVQNLEDLYPRNGAPSIEVECSIRILIMQFLQDLSDRQMEELLKDSLRTKRFCRYLLEEQVPDHSHFGRFRTKLGLEKVQWIFNEIQSQLNKRGLVGNMFSFIDASAIRVKEQLWKERDQAIAENQEKLNNTNIKNYSKDPDTRFGSKGKNKIWFGYKRHTQVDMRYGIIQNVVVTAANIPDHKGVPYLEPKNVIAFMDKGYDTRATDEYVRSRNCEPATIRKKNSKQADAKASAWRSKTRMPYESVFSHMNKRTRYRGIEKVGFKVIMESIAYNLKKTMKICAV